MNKLELVDHGHSEDFKMKINGAEIHGISEYKIKRTLLESELELKISIDATQSSIDIKN